MRIGILGLGGVGGFIAALLHKENINYICISNDTDLLSKTDKLKLNSKRFGNFSFLPRLENKLTHHVDILFITTKYFYLEKAIQRIPKNILKNTLTIPLLNGVKHYEILKNQHCNH